MADGRGPRLPVFFGVFVPRVFVPRVFVPRVFLPISFRHLALALALGQGACASGRTQAPLVAAPGQSVEHLEAGRGLFAGHCQSCHALPEPGELAPAAWPRKVAIMARKSGLSQAQIALVSDYLVAASQQAPASDSVR
jgi:mono/diheme cytochrome c family protein